MAGPEKKVELYRKHYGITLGKNVRFTGTPHWGTEPYLITIGDNVTITQDVVFHNHDGGVGLFRKEFPGINVFGRITIGNNVFIGSHTTILPGVSIGDHVVIGAGSVVSRDIPSNSVAVGVPAKVLKSIDEYKASTLTKAVYVQETDPVKRKKEILSKVK
jgi:acetyltransferase-like isoleucine patch superfamily enzyme